jgi:hypothetical protein
MDDQNLLDTDWIKGEIRMKKTSLGTIIGITLSTSAHAGFTVNASEVGNDVVLIGNGTLDLGMWENFGNVGGDISGQIQSARVFLGVDAFNTDIYGSPVNFTGPSSIDAIANGADSASGDALGFDFSGSGAIYLPDTFVSGSPLSNTTTFLNESFDTMGLVSGSSYTWTWDTPTGGQDFFTINIVPAPSVLAMLGLGGIAAGRRRR